MKKKIGAVLVALPFILIIGSNMYIIASETGIKMFVVATGISVILISLIIIGVILIITSE